MVPTTLTLRDGAEIAVRRARRKDIAVIVRLLADDPLGKAREDLDGDFHSYAAAFEHIDADRAQLLVVAVDGDAVVGTMQTTVIPGLSHRGALRANIEAVRVREDYRNRGLGAALVTWAVDDARERGCAIVQLTSNATREAAHRFYARLGFAASHVGFKLALGPGAAK